MATIENRSRYVVTIKNNDALQRLFPYSELARAKAYCAELRERGYKPKLGQLEDAYFVRIRQKGHKTQQFTVDSLADAESAVARIEAERKTGLFRDYTKAHNVTFADLIRRYAEEEGPKHKGWETVEKYKCRGWLDDLAGNLAQRDAQRKAEIAATGKVITARGAMRAPATGIEWMDKPFAQVETTDIEGYIRDRLDVVAPSTVDREIDVLSAICNVAVDVWKYHVADNPMNGVRRPKYFNERDRRLKSGEWERLLDAAIEEDRLRAIELRTQELMGDGRAQAALRPTVYQKKGVIQDALAECRAQAEQDYQHIPLYETFVAFQIKTAARRGETLNTTWDNVDLEARTVYLPETKNGRPRKLPLRVELVEMLEALPRTDDRVFPLSEDALKKAWKRICARAGIEDLHVHDLRHEAISLTAETGQFSLVDLQAFSGHRDVRMLLRYSHLCTTKLAHRLDAAFATTKLKTETTQVHRGRRRLRPGQGLSVTAILADAPEAARPKSVEPAPSQPAPAPANNVIAFPGARAASGSRASR
ncbi:integrase [Burkholderia pseudomallei]|uniref:integrase n=1 Tax=Burkholderia pseudomallei TaxID=28450 RepID=UPI0005371237|nr:site-specific integrase [Burkholderia pseudomallei]KGW85329.1 phage integrase family protein [Burkholderia pseudomallei MSHR332]